MEERDFKKFIVPFIILLLAIPSFFIIKPIIIPISMGLVLAYLLNSFYMRLNKKLNSKYISATIILIICIVIIIVPLIFLIPTTAKQSLEVYSEISNFDIAPIIQKIAPSLMNNQMFATEIQAASSQLKSTISEWILNVVKDLVTNSASIVFGVVILLFTFFFSLIESNKFRNYFAVIFPFPKIYQDKFYQKFTQVTDSVLYGEIIVGIAQGIISGIGYFVLGVPNALLITIVTTVVGVIPVIGPWLVWVPVDIYLFAQGDTAMAMGLLIYGLFVINWVDTLLRPQIVSSKAEMNSALALIGTIGGMYAFGPLGILLGPLVLAYLILLVEIYEDKNKEDSIVMRKEEPPVEIKKA